MSQISTACAYLLAYWCLNRRTLAEIEKEVVEQGKLDYYSQIMVTRGNRDKVAAWNQDLVRALLAFKVRLIDFNQASMV